MLFSVMAEIRPVFPQKEGGKSRFVLFLRTFFPFENRPDPAPAVTAACCRGSFGCRAVYFLLAAVAAGLPAFCRTPRLHQLNQYCW